MGISALTRVGVFLDRDGVLNRSLPGPHGVPRPPWTEQELEILPGAGEACNALHELGCVLVVVTNQPDVARGRLSERELDRINDSLRRSLPVDVLRVCCHDDADRCSCRKPAPGMLRDAARDLHLDLTASFMVGDRWRDIEAGRRAGCRTIFVGDRPIEEGSTADYYARSLIDAVPWIADELRARTSERQGGETGTKEAK